MLSTYVVGFFVQMRLASVSLAKLYTKTVLKELDASGTTGNKAALVAQSVRFTYRVHQVSLHCMLLKIKTKTST